jgi:hypothetical protein
MTLRWFRRKPASAPSRRGFVPVGEDRHTYWRRLDRDELEEPWLRGPDRGADRRPWMAPGGALRRHGAWHDCDVR